MASVNGSFTENESLQILDVSTPTPQVWYMDRAYDWHFLAPNFGAYFRMMLVHLGLPQWQLLFTPAGPTPRAKVHQHDTTKTPT